jgi:DnaJ family protein C protein 17
VLLWSFVDDLFMYFISFSDFNRLLNLRGSSTYKLKFLFNMANVKNPYDVLKIEQNASDAAIRTAFRKQALTCHPDKMAGDAVADSQAFLQLCAAMECLLDGDQRRGLDEQLNAAKLRTEKNAKLDARRRNLKTRLEERERESRANAAANSEEQDLICRLRREAEALLASKNHDDDLSAAFKSLGIREKSEPILKVKWDKAAENMYSAETLSVIFGKYGEVANVVMSRKHGRSALVEFKEIGAARIAFNCESGLAGYPLVLKALFSDTASRYITVQCARTNRSLLDFEDVILAKLGKKSSVH